MNNEISISMMFTCLGIITGLVQVITQVIKKATWDKIPTNIVVLILSEAITLIGFFAYMDYYNVQIVWYTVVGAIIVGFVVCYVAMFGYDKLIETFKQFTHKE